MARTITYSRALNEALREEMLRDERVVVWGEDVTVLGGIHGVTAGLAREFGPTRIRNTPISEAAFVGMGLGAALTGLRPVVEIMYVDFTAVCMDQIANQIAKSSYMFGGRVELPLVIRTQGGGGTGEAGQHNQSLEAWFVHTAGLKVVMPATPADAKGLLKTAIRDNSPVMFIEHKRLYQTKGPVPAGEHLVPFGQARICRAGDDITIVALSASVQLALDAAGELAEAGIEAEVIDPRTLEPFDLESVLASVRKTGRLIVIHEACIRCGVGGDIARQVMENAWDSLRGPIRVIAGTQTPAPYSTALEPHTLPSLDQVVSAARDLVGANESRATRS